MSKAERILERGYRPMAVDELYVIMTAMRRAYAQSLDHAKRARYARIIDRASATVAELEGYAMLLGADAGD